MTTRKFFRFALLIAILSGVISVALYLTTPGPIFYYTAGWLVVIALLLWFGNRLLTVALDKALPWRKFGNWRFFVHLLLGLMYLLLLVNVTYATIKISLTDDAPTLEQMIVMNVWGAAIFVPVFSLYFSLHFLRHWRTSELEVEQALKEKAQSQLSALKNHLDPHFLFNNLNILSSLIGRDAASSRTFIEKLADVYRSLLRNRSEDLITLAEELEFIQSYIYLIQVRFQDHIVFKIDVQKQHLGKLLPPLTMQMLVENAIKHNAITEGRPLIIELRAEENTMVVSNTLVPRSMESTATGSGLENIRQRYAHFTNQIVEISKTETTFVVRVPLLELESA